MLATFASFLAELVFSEKDGRWERHFCYTSELGYITEFGYTTDFPWRNLACSVEWPDQKPHGKATVMSLTVVIICSIPLNKNMFPSLMWRSAVYCYWRAFTAWAWWLL